MKLQHLELGDHRGYPFSYMLRKAVMDLWVRCVEKGFTGDFIKEDKVWPRLWVGCLFLPLSPFLYSPAPPLPVLNFSCRAHGVEDVVDLSPCENCLCVAAETIRVEKKIRSEARSDWLSPPRLFGTNNVQKGFCRQRQSHMKDLCWHRQYWRFTSLLSGGHVCQPPL